MIATSIDDIKNSYPIKFQTQMKKKTDGMQACSGRLNLYASFKPFTNTPMQKESSGANNFFYYRCYSNQLKSMLKGRL
jgi:hypothetical protein